MGKRRSGSRAEDRRMFLKSVMGVGAVLTLGKILSAGSSEANGPHPPIPQPAQADSKHFMERAMKMRRLAVASGDQGFGAIIVKGGEIVGQAPSRVIVRHDPTAHGEMEAIRDAGRRLGTGDLSGCVMYTTARPCRMCETAGYWANLARVYYGSEMTDAGPPRYSSCPSRRKGPPRLSVYAVSATMGLRSSPRRLTTQRTVSPGLR